MDDVAGNEPAGVDDLLAALAPDGGPAGAGVLQGGERLVGPEALYAADEGVESHHSGHHGRVGRRAGDQRQAGADGQDGSERVDELLDDVPGQPEGWPQRGPGGGPAPLRLRRREAVGGGSDPAEDVGRPEGVPGCRVPG